MEFSWLLLILLLLLAWMILVRIHESIRNYPPSRIGIPLFGRFPIILLRSLMNNSDFFTELSLDSTSKGDVSSVFLGTRRVIILSSFDAIFDALSKQGHDFAWRPNFAGFTKYRLINYREGDPPVIGGIGMSSGDLWREHRRFALSVLRDLGMGRNVTEQKIQIETNYLSEELKALDGSAVAPNRIFTRSVSNIISQFVFGFRSSYNNYEFEVFNEAMKQVMQEEDVGTFLTFLYPNLEDTFVSNFFGNKYADLEKGMIDFIDVKVSEVETQLTGDDSTEPEHFIEAFLRKQRSELETNSFCRRQLILTVYDLFAAGSETTSTFLNWAVIYLSVHQQWQEDLRREIDEQFDSVKSISFGRRSQCHKTMAFIDEVHRHSTITPNGVPHAAKEECLFRGYRIPKDAYIIPSLRSVHFDPQLWSEPRRFDPGRFLNNEGEYQASKFLIPFGLGKRMCLGEGLARMEIFMFLASIVKCFQVDLDDDAKEMKEQVFVGINILDIYVPKEHKIFFKARLE